MKFSAVAVLAAVAGAQAWANETVVTDVVTAYTTYCPYATQLTYGSSTYTITEATTLTITDCPCTITRSITTSSSVICSTCAAKSSVAPVYSNSTSSAAPAKVTTVVGTTSVAVVASKTTAPATVPTAGAGKVAALSGAGFAGVLGLAAMLL